MITRPTLAQVLCISYLAAIGGWTNTLAAVQAPTGAEVSRELRALFEADQSEREGGRVSPEADRRRLARVKSLLARESLRAGPDYYYAAMIFQHSTDRTGRDHLVAHVLAMTAALLGEDRGRWLAAAALDRFLVFNDFAQFFGTQFERDGSGRWAPGTVDGIFTEQLRLQFRIPTRDSLQRRADRWNQ